MYTYTIKNRSELCACYDDFRKKALNVFRTDVHTIGFCRNRHDTEIQILQADNAKEDEIR